MHRCGHCKSLAPAYEKVAESLHGIVNVVAVDCDAETNKPTCGQYGVQGFPTLKLFPPGKPPKDYQGEAALPQSVRTMSSHNCLELAELRQPLSRSFVPCACFITYLMT